MKIQPMLSKIMPMFSDRNVQNWLWWATLASLLDLEHGTEINYIFVVVILQASGLSPRARRLSLRPSAVSRLTSRLIYYNIKAWNEVISQDEVGSKKVGKIQREKP